jgi:Leucine-rich repeat (LRR) protein
VKELQALRALTELDLECNLIQHLGDAGIGELHKLLTLKLSYNQIL